MINQPQDAQPEEEAAKLAARIIDAIPEAIGMMPDPWPVEGPDKRDGQPHRDVAAILLPLLQTLDQWQAETRWRAIATAPKDGTNVLAWDQRPFVATWHTAQLCWVEVGTSLTLFPSAWMPLPSPPGDPK